MTAVLPRRITLGTAQFGDPYGATNVRRHLADAEVANIVSAALESGITWFDTAIGYGNAQSRLGQAISGVPGIRVVSKLASVAAIEPAVVGARVRQLVEQCLEEVRQPQLAALLLHRTTDLDTASGREAIATMVELRDEGLIGELGASVYDRSEIEMVNQSAPELSRIQVPGSVLDQRLLADATWRRPGTKVDVRSAFLQGVLLASDQQLASGLPGLVAPVARVRCAAEDAGLPLTDFLLGCVLRHDWVNSIVVGVTSLAELQQLVDASTFVDHAIDYSELAIDDGQLINPANWPPGLQLL